MNSLRLPVTAVLLFVAAATHAATEQTVSPGGLWRRVDVVPAAKRTMQPWIRPQKFTAFECDFAALKQRLAQAPREFSGLARHAPLTVHLPTPDGGYARFRIVESPVMEPALAARFPQIKTFVGQGIDDPGARVRLDHTPQGFHAQVLAPGGACYIDPYSRGDTSTYACYYKRDYRAAHQFQCLTEAPPRARAAKVGIQRTSNGETLKIFRLACAATGEYTAFHGGSVALGQAAIVTAINRVTGIYENELSIRLILVADNSSVVYTNGGTDPYTNGDASAMSSENQTNLDSVIGTANYDIGHVFGIGTGGVAFLGGVCVGGQKARGATARNPPIGDPFYVDYVAHEIGHQFGGNHTFNGTQGSCSGGNRNGSTAYEPGSGSTIQAYAGICGGDNLQPNSDPYFHFISLDEMSDYVTTGNGTCSSNVATGNNLPVANAGANFTIPQGTPFELTASATDVDGDILTFTWEEMDLGPAQALSDAQNTTSPLFRSWTGTVDPVRTIPRLQDLLNNTVPTGEKLPTLSRTLNFRITVRDNVAGGGAYDMDEMGVTVDATTGPFLVTSPNTATTLSGPQTVTWSVAGTTGGSVGAATVNILLSTNGGNTFDIALVTNTLNDGTQSVVLPNIENSTARIKVQGAGNIFFDISNADFTIESFDSLEIDPAGGLSTSGLVGGPFNPTCRIYRVVNSGGGGITWTSFNGQAWVDVVPGGGPLASGATTTVNVCINDTVNGLGVGTHNDTVNFSNLTSQVGQGRSVTLDVLAFTSIIEAVTSTLVAETCTPTNGAVDPDEAVAMAFSLRNTGTRPTTNLVGTLLTFGGITLPGAPQVYGVVDTSGVAVAQSFAFTPTGTCGSVITARLALQDGALNIGTVDFSIPLGGSIGGTQEFSYSGPPVTIPDNAASDFDVTLAVSNLTGAITDLDFKIGGETCTGTDNGINHAWVGDLTLTLTSPQGTMVTLMDQPGSGTWGSSGENFCQTILDDDGGGSSIESIGDTGPFSGNFTPNQPLSAFDGEDPNGTWTLNVVDDFAEEDGGDIRAFSICIVQEAALCCTGLVATADLVVGKTDSQDPLTNGNALAYTITVSNLGASIASGVVVTDTLPAGVTFSIAGSSAGCTESGGTVTCPIGPLAPAAVTTVVVAVNVATSTVGAVTNFATASGAETDPNLVNNLAVETTTILDTDGDGSPDFDDLDDDDDGMPDDWEIANDLDPRVANPNGNADGDDFTDLQEYIADTDPQSSNSFFNIEDLMINSPATIQFDSSTGRFYTLEFSDDLIAIPFSNHPVYIDIPGSGSNAVFIDTNAPSLRIYRIGVELAP